MAKILIIEDDDLLRRTYSSQFLSMGHEVSTTPDGEEGLKLAREGMPDIILLDIMLPKKSGLQFLEEFDTKKHPATKVIVFTVLSDIGPMKAAMALGAKRFITKQMTTPKEMANIVDYLLEEK